MNVAPIGFLEPSPVKCIAPLGAATPEDNVHLPITASIAKPIIAPSAGKTVNPRRTQNARQCRRNRRQWHRRHAVSIPTNDKANERAVSDRIAIEHGCDERQRRQGADIIGLPDECVVRKPLEPAAHLASGCVGHPHPLFAAIASGKRAERETGPVSAAHPRARSEA
jgi:hypothetical protein